MIQVKEVIVIDNSRKVFFKKSLIKGILMFFKYLFKKKVNNEEQIYNYLKNEYNIS